MEPELDQVGNKWPVRVGALEALVSNYVHVKISLII